MKNDFKRIRIVVVLWLGGVVLAGCAHHSQYVMVLNNGLRITTSGKPRLSHGNYYYKDASGRESFVSSGRVREVAPASMIQDDKARFKPSGVK